MGFTIKQLVDQLGSSYPGFLDKQEALNLSTQLRRINDQEKGDFTDNEVEAAKKLLAEKFPAEKSHLGSITARSLHSFTDSLSKVIDRSRLFISPSRIKISVKKSGNLSADLYVQGNVGGPQTYMPGFTKIDQTIPPHESNDLFGPHYLNLGQASELADQLNSIHSAKDGKFTALELATAQKILAEKFPADKDGAQLITAGNLLSFFGKLAAIIPAPGFYQDSFLIKITIGKSGNLSADLYEERDVGELRETADYKPGLVKVDRAPKTIGDALNMDQGILDSAFVLENYRIPSSPREIHTSESYPSKLHGSSKHRRKP